MVTALVEATGGGALPDPNQVLDAGEQHLKRESRLGFRTMVVIEGTEELLAGNLITRSGNLNGNGPSYDQLLKIRGIGPYSASHLRVLLHDFRRVPVDSEVSKYCEQRHHTQAPNIDHFFEPWGRYRFLGYKLGRSVLDSNWIGD